MCNANDSGGAHWTGKKWLVDSRCEAFPFSKRMNFGTLLLSPFMKVIWNFRFNTSKNYNVNFDLDLRAASSVRISETKRDFGVGPKPQHSLCSRVSPTLSWKWPSVHARARFGSVYFSLSGVLNVRGGWVGSGVWDKVLKKRFFFDTFPKLCRGFGPTPKSLFVSEIRTLEVARRSNLHCNFWLC